MTLEPILICVCFREGSSFLLQTLFCGAVAGRTIGVPQWNHHLILPAHQSVLR